MAEPIAPGSVAPSRLRRVWGARLWAHAAVLGVFLLLLVVVMTPQSAFTEDEGAYALQARSLEHGSWEYRYKAASVDPEGTWFPVVLSTVNGAHYYPYVKHPAYPLLLGWAKAVAGTTLGLHLIPLVGAVGAAVAAWLLAGEVDASLRRPAFWMVAASPVLVNGTLLWAHAPSAALAGFAAFGGARIVRRGLTPVDSVAVAVALVGGVLLRSEGLLFAGAVVAAVCLLRLRGTGFVAAAAAGAVLGVPVAIAAVVERLWVKAIVGSAAGDLAVRGGSGGGSTSYVGQRLSGAFHSLLQGHDSAPAAGLAVLVAVALIVGLAGTALRRWGPHSKRDLFIAGGAVACLYALRIALYPTEAVTGLFAAWPVAVLGLLLVRRRDRQPAVDLILAALALFGAAVLLTEYPEGGGLEWGGRFFSPAVVPLAVLASAVLGRRLREVPSAARRAATAAVVGLAAAPAIFGLVTVGLIRADQDHFIAAAARHPAQVTVTTVDAYPRLAWRTHDRLSWMLTDDAGLPELLGTLRTAGVADVILVTRADVAPANLSAYDDVSKVDEPAFGEVGATMLHLRAGG